ncbi:MAG: transglycosylase domain-containing protein [Erysipelotrichaceae bacterium]|nr:transglycosylase domain-containing protein [Erysipelotrichaceae bacterium]
MENNEKKNMNTEPEKVQETPKKAVKPKKKKGEKAEAFLAVAKDSSKDTKRSDARPKGKLITRIAAGIVWTVVALALTAGLFALKTADEMTENMPELSRERLESQESSVIYDAEGTPIIELGLYLRENIEYSQMPTSLIDAFLAIEDSRFFSHAGFDLPRFTMAALINLRSGDFSQGGSTVDMQLVKNSYFQVDAGTDSTIAEREGMGGVQRKAQEIILAMEADHEFTKEEIFALFLNKVNFGNNIRGVEKASQYYFGKGASELTLPESAFLAGIINSPNNYNPYNDIEKYTGNAYLNENIQYLENATLRRNEVLDLMANHGYISKEEAELAKTVRMEDLLSGRSEKFSETNQYYQSYIDAVIEEVQSSTGLDPYTTAMQIYTNMDPHMQRYVYDLQNENIEGYNLKFRSDKSQNAIVIMDNQNGALIALGGGRGQTESRMFNRATSAWIQPGSTIKPIFEYALAFEWLGWATSHTITDQPIYLYNGHNLVRNAGGQTYTGDMLMTEAVARSLNTPAVQTLMAVLEEKTEEDCINYLNSIGFDLTVEDFDLQFAIGGNRMVITPVKLGAAHGMLMNKGYYVAPHTINYIEYADGSRWTADTVGKQVLSEEAAYLAGYLEGYNVAQTNWVNYMGVLRTDYPIYAKTGTTDWGKSGRDYGIPTGAAKDSWLVCQTSQYTVTIWSGFDKADVGTYFTTADDRYNQKGYLGRAIQDELVDYFQYEPHDLERPEGVVDITHIKGVFPYCYPTSGTPVTGMIKKEFATLVDISTVPREKKVGTLSGMGLSFNEDGSLNISWNGFGGGSGGGTMDISATNAYGETTHATGRMYYPRYIFINPGYFYADIYVNGTQVNSIGSESPYYTTWPSAESGSTITVCGYTSNDYSQKCADIVK